jgi:hypothetical protein
MLFCEDNSLRAPQVGALRETPFNNSPPPNIFGRPPACLYFFLIVISSFQVSNWLVQPLSLCKIENTFITK